MEVSCSIPCMIGTSVFDDENGRFYTGEDIILPDRLYVSFSSSSVKI